MIAVAACQRRVAASESEITVAAVRRLHPEAKHRRRNCSSQKRAAASEIELLLLLYRRLHPEANLLVQHRRRSYGNHKPRQIAVAIGKLLELPKEK